MKLRSWLLGGIMLFSGWASAQDGGTEESSSKFTIHGNLDLYYKHSFHGSKEATTSFTGTNNRFELGMAALQLAYQDKKSGVVVDLGFGPKARDFAYTDQGAMAAIQQAYVYYEPVEGLRFSVGSWSTHIGYEVLAPAENANYSMSYLFSTGPFSNTGLKAEYAIGDHHLMAGISNPTDFRQVPDSVLNRKTIIARYSYEKENGLVLALNYSGGKQVDTANIQQLDAVATIPVTENWTVGWNGSIVFRKYDGTQADLAHSRQHWWGQAVYLKTNFSEKVQLALREEYFTDKEGISPIPLQSSVWSSTATLSYREGPFAVMPEIRWDNFSKPFAGSTHQGQLYGLIGVTYQF